MKKAINHGAHGEHGDVTGNMVFPVRPVYPVV